MRCSVLVSCCLLGALAGCGGAPAAPPEPPAGAAVRDLPAGPTVESNILRGDYAGSRACADCHADVYRKWAMSPMRRMTRLSPEAAIQAPFDGSVFRFKGDTVTLEQHEGRRYMRIASQKAGSILYRVSKVIGGRYREDFAGYEVSDTAADSAPVGDPHAEPILPVSYLIFSKSFRYKGYSVMVTERPYIEKGNALWRQTCIFCHNTAPAFASVYDDLLGKGAPVYQGSVSDRLLPEDRLWKVAPRDEAGLARALNDEIAFLRERPAKHRDGTSGELLAEAIRATRGTFGQEHLVEVGIGCEACHNGSKEHVKDPSLHPTYELRSPLLSVSTPDPRRQGPAGKAEWINHTCARCHTVLFSRYPYTWEGGLRAVSPGGSSINSGEARDFLLGACSSKMSCAACHDPHTEDSRDKLDKLGTVAGNQVCVECHTKYGDAAARKAHTHHAPEGEGSACLSCHMPRKNTGLGYRLTRYHRIGSPSDKARVEKDRPVECALCHADRSVAWMVDAMEQWWGRRADRAALHALYGPDLGVNPLLSAVSAGKPHEQITAAAVLGERGQRGAAAALVPLLSSEYPLVRYYARASVERLLGRPLPVDLDGEAAQIDSQSRAFVAAALAERR